MASLRRDLSVLLGAGIGGTCLAAGWLVWVLVCANSRDDFDAALAAKAGSLGTLLAVDARGIEFDFADEVMPEFHRAEGPEYFELWVQGGDLFERSLSLGTADLPRRTGPAADPAVFDLELPDGRAGRAVGVLVPVDWSDSAPVDHSRHDVFVELVVAVSREGLDHGDARVLHALWSASVALAVAAALLVWMATHRTTSRLRRLTEQLVHVDRDSLGWRVDTSGLAAELVPLGETLNTLLERLQSAVVREKRMTSNIAHELRTPVTELRAAVEIAQRWPDDEPLAAQALRVAGAVSQRMTATIQTLLRLGRLEAEGVQLEIASIDLASVVREVGAEFEAGARSRGLRLTVQGLERVFVRADGPLVRILVRNLLENAIEHSPAGTEIVADLRANGAGVEWRLTNPAPELSAEDVRCMGEPFWSKERSRSSTLHPGLGLSLSSAIAKALGLELHIELERGQLCVLVRAAPG